MNLQVTIKPSIKLYYSRSLNNKWFVDQVLYGAEEEGIPVDVEQMDEEDPLILAHKASVDSILGTGIGLSPTEAVVQQEKLPVQKPVFRALTGSGEEELRKVGANGARLVKRMPLKLS